MLLIDLLATLIGADTPDFPWWGASQSKAAPVRDFTRAAAGLKSGTLRIVVASGRLTATCPLKTAARSGLIESLGRASTQATADVRLSDSLGSVSLAEQPLVPAEL